MSNFLIGCITFIILVLITAIKNILEKKISEDTKQSVIHSTEEIMKKKLDEGKDVDLNFFEEILKEIEKTEN